MRRFVYQALLNILRGQQSLMDIKAAFSTTGDVEPSNQALFLQSSTSLPKSSRARSLHLFSKQDRAFGLYLIYQVLFYKSAMDAYCQSISARPFHQSPLKARVLIYMGLASRFHMTMPSYAAYSEVLKLCAGPLSSYKGFVNALLRRADREAQTYDWFVQNKEYVFPEVWKTVFESSLPQPAQESLKEAMLPRTSRDVLDLQLHHSQGIKECEALFSSSQFILSIQQGSKNFSLPQRCIELSLSDYGSDTATWPGFDQGMWWVQNRASALVSAAVDELKGEQAEGLYWDACAAPGGKTLSLANILDRKALLGKTASVLASDLKAARCQVLTSNIGRLGWGKSIQVRVGSVQKLALELQEACAVVVVDAPCSSLGLLLNQPDVLWRRTPSDLGDLAETQLNLLTSAAQAVRPGGLLVFSLCSFLEEEGPEVVKKFLKKHSNFHRQAIQAWGKTDLVVLPSRDGADGVYACALKKN